MNHTIQPLTRGWTGAAAFVWLLAMSAVATATDFSDYEYTCRFRFPTIADPSDQGPVVFDNLSDGRIVAVSTLITDPDTEFAGVPKVYLETRAGSRQFDFLGDLPLPAGAQFSSGGGAFLRASEAAGGARRIAVGNNRLDPPWVGVFTESDLLASGPAAMPIDWYEVEHSSAAWFDNRNLAINSGTFSNSHIQLLDTDSDPSAPDSVLVVDGIEGASAGVGFDSHGNLYTANGFENDVPEGSSTGDIKRFDHDDWMSVLSGASPLGFETQGSKVATILSGGSLAFDQEDNMLVGGSNFFGGGEADFFAIVPGPGVGDSTRTFDPDAAATSFYVLTHNEGTGELYAYEPFALDFPSNIDNTAVYVVRVPLPGDMDCDLDVDLDDVDEFLLGLLRPSAYEDAFGAPSHVQGDTDGDEDLDLDDVVGYVPILSPPPQSNLQTVPEPSTMGCSGSAILACLCLNRSRRRFHAKQLVGTG